MGEGEAEAERERGRRERERERDLQNNQVIGSCFIPMYLRLIARKKNLHNKSHIESVPGTN